MFIFSGSTKQALKILMHISCPSVDERDEEGDYNIVYSLK